MKQNLLLTLALAIAGVCCIVAAFFGQYYYTRYQTAANGLEDQMNSFNMRLRTLEGHKSRELTPVHVWGIISTTDQPADEGMRFYDSSEQHSNNFYEIINCKGGPLIRPEFRIPTAITTNCEYDIKIAQQFGIIADAWLSHAQPYQDLAAFEEFRLSCPNKTNILRLVAKKKPNASVKMRFDIVVLCEK